MEAIERKLWGSADTLRANSTLASNQYFTPLMGIIFLRHAYNRFLQVRGTIEAGLPSRGGRTRELAREDFSSARALFLRRESQFDYLVNLPDEKDLVQAVIEAMTFIEADNPRLEAVLPKDEFRSIPKGVLGNILRVFNSDELRQAPGDLFGRIYEYFLTQFADQGAHDNGEFFTPMSLVQLIVNILEPDRGLVLDPACGSGGMFVQSGHFIEKAHKNPAEACRFRGLEKNNITIRLARMNLAVHGLEGEIKQAISYYEDPYDLVGQADFVMANPPFNVDDVDAEKIKHDPRLPFGLPSFNKKSKKISNGNYLWISYFYSYLNEQGRAGFVMSSQASSAGGEGEMEIRRKIIESGVVDVMVDIRPNFFYTRSVPCQLWFFNRAKTQPNTILMLDARSVFRQVNRKICDFSPEQLRNLSAIVRLYRGQKERFLNLLADYNQQAATSAVDAVLLAKEAEQRLRGILCDMRPSLEKKAVKDKTNIMAAWLALHKEFEEFCTLLTSFQKLSDQWGRKKHPTLSNSILREETAALEALAQEAGRLGQALTTHGKNLAALIALFESSTSDKAKLGWRSREIIKARKEMEDIIKQAEAALNLVGYFQQQALWLEVRFPDGEYVDVQGLVKKVTLEEVAANGYSLTPGRYVGVAPQEEDADFDFAETMRAIHGELAALNDEAADLAKIIQENLRSWL